MSNYTKTSDQLLVLSCCDICFWFLYRHRWMHCMTDHTPIVEPPEERKFIMDHLESKTGTKDEYVPYSTTRPKIHSWKPNQN